MRGAGDYERQKTPQAVGMTYLWIGVVYVDIASAHSSLSLLRLSPKPTLSWSCCCHGVNVWCSGPRLLLTQALRAAGMSKFTMVVSIFSMWTFRIGWASARIDLWAGDSLGVWMPWRRRVFRSICSSAHPWNQMAEATGGGLMSSLGIWSIMKFLPDFPAKISKVSCLKCIILLY